MEARRVTVTGRVQGVGFRWATMSEALRLGVCGWVRNRPDGTVETLIQGEAAPVERMLGWLREGPPGARVGALRVLETEAEDGLEGFHIRG